jgi:hypothetical protein
MSDVAVPRGRALPVVLVSAAITSANLVALYLLLLWVLTRYDETHRGDGFIVTQDFWVPMVLGMGALTVANALVLLPRRATRRIGVGVLLGLVVPVVGLGVLLTLLLSELY